MERKEILLVVLIVVLLLTTAVQSIQLVTLSNNPVVATSGSGITSGSGSVVKQAGSPASVNLQELPSMVGGC